MQSSTAVMFRALVMLGCVVAIPLAAVVGKSLPDLVRGLLDGRWPGRSASAYGSLGEAPRFEMAAPVCPSGGAFPCPTDGMSPAVSAEQTSLDRQKFPLEDTSVQPERMAGPLSWPVVAASHEAPVGSASGSAAPAWASGGVSRPGLDDSRPGVSRVVPAPGSLSAIGPDRRQTSVPEPYKAADPAVGLSDPPAKARSTVDQFTYIQERLRELGATYYLLESWGSREQLYRFYCKVAVGGNPNYTHYFEATDSDPLQAMGQVLRQVEGWRAGPR